MTTNAEMFENSKEAENTAGCKSMDWQTTEETNEQSCIGENRRVQRVDETRFRCILCSEESPVTKKDECMVYAAFIQKSSVLLRYQETDSHGQLKYLETSTHPLPHVGTCGHVMHASCFEKYFNNEMIKENRRPYRNRTPILFDIEKREFLCPLCRFLSNSLLPLLPSLGGFNENNNCFKSIPDELDFNTWIVLMGEIITNFKSMNSVEETSLQGQQNFEKISVQWTRKKYEDTVINNLASRFASKFDANSMSDESVISDSISEYIDKFCHAIHAVAPFPTTTINSEKYLVTWLSCSYTIESLEMFLRATNKAFNEEFSIRYTACLSGFVRMAAVLGNNMKIFNQSFVIYICDLYDMLLGKKKSSFLEWDMFSMMATLLFSTRCVLFNMNKEDTIPKGNVLDHNILTSMFLMNVVKIVVTHEMNTLDTMDTDGNICADCGDNLVEIYKTYNIYYENDYVMSKQIKQQLVHIIKKKSQTFLRCACLFFHAITDVELPKDDGFESLATYLDLKTDICSYFNSEMYYSFISMITNANQQDLQTVKQNIRNKKSDDIVPIIQAIPPVRQLIDLPEDYTDLINSVSNFSCPNNLRDESRNPTMCLVCGEILCSQSFCCQKELDKHSVGSCTYHMHTCGAGVGMFLRIRDAEILLLGLNKGCFIPAPYLDEYGETDQGLRRGNPLKLCEERYKKLHIMWLSHGIHEEITRKTEIQQTLFATQWQNL